MFLQGHMLSTRWDDEEEEEEEEGCCTSYGFPKTLTCQARVYNNEECSKN